MEPRGPYTYTLDIAGSTYSVIHSDGTRHFVDPVTHRNAKLYVIAKDKEPLYIGQTVQAMSTRLRQGFRADGASGYHGYPWKSHADMLGLHPLVGFGMFAVDWMLFGAESGTLAMSWPISIGVAAALTIPSILIQKYGFKDDWGLAVGKGLMVGVLTAIPTALPSIVPLAGGMMGAVALLSGNKNPG
ncbi:MAG: hypothetical protein JXA89_17140 [Anaerolineae bacterium]|nr:hypothetical protein [Anaerolineae bacterium]